MGAPVYEFGEFTLDCQRFELSRGGDILKLEKKPMELLILLASSNGRLVTRTEIAERLWEREVFVDTEHGINTAVRKIRQALRDDPEEPRFIQTVTGKGYRFIGPIAEKPTQAAEESASAALTDRIGDAQPQARSHRLPVWAGTLGVAMVIALIIVLTLAARSRFHNPNLHIASLAVLPLDNLSGDPGQDYFADGMTDELITMLAKNSRLRIVSRTSVMQYKRAKRPLREIAQGLGVDGVLEGSVARSNNRLHMTVQLIDGRSDTHVWAESFDRDGNDSVSLPEEVAQAVAKQLRSAVPEGAPGRYVRPEAHDAYLHGRYLWFTDHNEKAGEYFLKATELQPDYALAWTGVADYYGVGAVEGEMSPKDSLPCEKSAALKAVSLDDSLAQTHLSLCAALYFVDWDWPRALQECSRAIELDPKLADAHHMRAKILTALNRHAEAIEADRTAMELNAFARPWALTFRLELARQYDAALKEGLARLESNPGDLDLVWIVSDTYRRARMFSQSVQTAQKALLLTGDTAGAQIERRHFQEGGYRAVVVGRLQYWKDQSRTKYVSPVWLAGLTAQLGRREETLALLEQGYGERSPLLLEVQDDPAYDFLHAEERYRSIIKKMGLPLAY